MSKKKLSHNQLERIRKNKSDILEKHAIDINSPLFDGKVINRSMRHAIVSDKDNHNYKCFIHNTITSLVVGDNILFQKNKDSYVIVTRKDRSSYLERVDSYKRIKVIAANIDQAFIINSHLPQFSTNIIDKYLIMCHKYNIEAIIVLNKIDLLDKIQLHEYKKYLDVYSSLGYKVIYISSINNDGIDELISLLNDKTNILVGQSGVGKSSIINSIFGENTALTNMISENSNLGQHTTTSSFFYKKDNFAIIDSPGIREILLNNIDSSQILRGYIEIADYALKCKFKNCNHLSDLGCAVVDAVYNTKKISEFRYHNFKKLLSNL